MARMVASESEEAQEEVAIRGAEIEEAEMQSAEERDAVNRPGYQERVFQIVRRIPAGCVMTYGQLAEILGEGYTPRTVGFVMHAADEETTPWHRVINSQGGCSTGRVILPPDKQQRMLEAEGVEFDSRGRCKLERYRWTPEEYAQESADEQSEQPSLFQD